MRESPRTSESSSWSPSLARLVDTVCNRFEASWKAGQRPRLEDYLSDAPELRGSVLLRELLALELIYRRNRGEKPAAEEYQKRFPEYAEVIGDLFVETSPVESATAASVPPTTFHTPVRSLRTPGVTEGDAAIPATLLESTELREPSWPCIPGYEILSELGRGGMGVVYKARQTSLQRLVALKIVRAGAHAAPEELTRFRTEAEAAAQLQHAHIVQIYEVGEHNDLPYLSMEFVEGGSLHTKLGGVPQPSLPAAQLVEALARAIHAAHERRIVHRDLKPANVLLTADGTPKITDFGLAKRLDSETGQTLSGAIMGTPPYMAPEQAAGKTKQIGPGVDVYALGAILYEMLTGRPPFRGVTVYDTLEQVISQEPVPPRRLQPVVPRDLETICLKCLEKEPSRRYPSAAALAEDLRHFGSGEPIQARPTRVWVRTLKWARRRPTTAALVAVSSFTVLVLLGVFCVWAEATRAIAAKEVAEARIEKEEARRLGDAQYLLLVGKREFTKRNWDEAEAYISNALKTMGDDVSLGNLRAEAEELLAKAKSGMEQQDRYRQFVQLRNDTLTHMTPLPGMDRASSLERTRESAQKALALFGVYVDSPVIPPLDVQAFTVEEQSEITEAIQELLLTLAYALAQRNVEQGDRLLDQAFKLGPPTPAYYLRRADHLALRGDEPGARAARAQAEDCPPTTLMDYFLLGGEQLRSGRPEEAMHDFQKVLLMRPNHLGAQYLLAICQLRSNRPDAAWATLTACAIAQPKFSGVYLLRGLVHGKLGDYKAAEADFREAEQLGLDNSAKYALYNNRGALRFQQREFEAAERDYKLAIKLWPRQYNAYLNLAQVYGEQKKWPEAFQELNQAIQWEPKLAALYRIRAYFNRQRGDPVAALEDLEQAIMSEPLPRSSPEVVHDHFDKGLILDDLKRYQEAVVEYERALKINPTASQVHFSRARALLELQHPKTAARWVALANVSPHANLAGIPWAALGLPPSELLQTQRYQAAIQSLDSYLERVRVEAFMCLLSWPPDANLVGIPLAVLDMKNRKNRELWADTYRTRGQLKERLHDYPGAIEDYTRALATLRNSPTFVQRGWAYLFGDAQKLALRDFQEAIQLDVDNVEAYSGRGLARTKLGQYREGIEDAKEVLRRSRKPLLVYSAARIYAQAVAKAEADVRLSGRWAMVRDYQDRAVEAIRDTLRLLPAKESDRFWWDTILPDSAINPIRESTGFRRMMEDHPRHNR